MSRRSYLLRTLLWRIGRLDPEHDTYTVCMYATPANQPRRRLNVHASAVLFQSSVLPLTVEAQCLRTMCEVPMLTFLNPAKLRELWNMPIIFAVTAVVSMASAQLLGILLKLEKYQRWARSIQRGPYNLNPLAVSICARSL
ncbi:hypothetical protein DAEQUDRAFT_287244 [Daedalea quercina L-15889]|uniref:Uncharacterized protein n=1 Tax=Daedalea quercina L-15889 TaxID=1314783 RepID=A0A165TWI3_9APHY|nr:hypothetical protein DAEQUDRAFT_287244 [Daedalea quercina L-15889]